MGIFVDATRFPSQIPQTTKEVISRKISMVSTTAAKVDRQWPIFTAFTTFFRLHILLWLLFCQIF
jgi:hypothetical protein